MSAWGKSFGLAFGVAFGAVALQPVEPPVVEPVQQVQAGGGSSSEGGGRGWVYKDHTWVKLTKTAKVGGKTRYLEATTSTSTALTPAVLNSTAGTLVNGVSCIHALEVASATSMTREITPSANTGVTLTKTAACLQYRPTTTYSLDLDELVVALKVAQFI